MISSMMLLVVFLLFTTVATGDAAATAASRTSSIPHSRRLPTTTTTTTLPAFHSVVPSPSSSRGGTRKTYATPSLPGVCGRVLLPPPVMFTRSGDGFGAASSMMTTSSSLAMSTGEQEGEKKKSDLPMLLDPGTKGGALFLTLILLIIPFIIYNIATGIFGMDGIVAGRNIGVGFTVTTSLLWASTYVFRVATKDMTYAKQLKDYENAVIAKRLEELDEDEITAMMEDIEREEF